MSFPNLDQLSQFSIQKYFPNFPNYLPDELSNFFLTFLILQPRIGEDLFRPHFLDYFPNSSLPFDSDILSKKEPGTGFLDAHFFQLYFLYIQHPHQPKEYKSTPMMFYICASVKGVILSLSACKRLGIVDTVFPQIAKMKEDGNKAVEEDATHLKHELEVTKLKLELVEYKLHQAEKELSLK